MAVEASDLQLLSAQEVADMLQVPRATLSKWRWQGTGPRALKVGKHTRYRRQDVEAWLRSLEDEDR